MRRLERTVKHFSLHRITGTELRFVSDVEAGVLPVLQEEEGVIRSYARSGVWPHRWVSLFVLEDLQPLLRQLRPGTVLPPGVAEALDHPPVVNVYDLADLTGCHVFVNRQAMAAEGYWHDRLATRALLAHEHAHPLAENETTRASRGLRVDLSLGGADGRPWNAERQARVQHLLTALAGKLCLHAPREIFTNEMTIRRNFRAALLHLDRRNMANAAASVKGREGLREQLQHEVAQGQLGSVAAELLLLIGDLNGYLDLALEVAPFFRAGCEDDARDLEAVLEREVFPHLEPEVGRIYADLRDRYIDLRSNLTATEVEVWEQEVGHILTEALANRGLDLRFHIRSADSRETPTAHGT